MSRDGCDLAFVTFENDVGMVISDATRGNDVSDVCARHPESLSNRFALRLIKSHRGDI